MGTDLQFPREADRIAVSARPGPIGPDGTVEPLEFASVSGGSPFPGRFVCFNPDRAGKFRFAPELEHFTNARGLAEKRGWA